MIKPPLRFSYAEVGNRPPTEAIFVYGIPVDGRRACQTHMPIEDDTTSRDSRFLKR